MVTKSTPHEHKSYRALAFSPEASLDNLTADEIACLHKYGAWLKALMQEKILPYTDEQRAFVEMCNGKSHPQNELAKTWKKYQLNVMYEIALKMDGSLAAADTKFTYAHVVTRFRKIAAQGHTQAIEWLKKEGITFAPPEDPPLLDIARVYPKRYVGGDLMDMVVSGSFGSGARR
mgnify:CR=1 FL=1